VRRFDSKPNGRTRNWSSYRIDIRDDDGFRTYDFAKECGEEEKAKSRITQNSVPQALTLMTFSLVLTTISFDCCSGRGI